MVIARAIEPNTAARRIPRARKAGSACFSLAMTSSRRMATSYQKSGLHSSIGVLPLYFLPLFGAFADTMATIAPPPDVRS
jgi:hypothetical protein